MLRVVEVKDRDGDGVVPRRAGRDPGRAGNRRGDHSVEAVVWVRPSK